MAVEPAQGELGAVAPVAPAGIGEIDQPIAREIGMQHHVVQPALPPFRDRGGKSGDGCGIQHAVGGDIPQAAGPFSDQHPSVGEKRQRPRAVEPAGQDTDPHGVPLGPFNGVRAGQP